jgi:hypothetical protein
MPTYQTVSEDIIKDDSGRLIPVDPLNADYQDYLAWVAAGNTATNFSPPLNTDNIYIYGNLSVGNSEVYDATDGSFLYNNNGVLGERATTGSSAVVLSQGATITNATINTPTITGNLYVGSTPYQGDANSVLTATGTGVEWNFSSGLGDVVRNITPTITDLALVGAVIADNGYGLPGQVLQAIGTGGTGDPYSVRWVNQRGTRNALINGDFAIDQRVRPGDSITHVSSSVFPNNDDAYTFDRWYILSDGNNRVEVNQETSDLPGEQYDYQQTGCRLRVVNTSASAFKFGIAQIIEQRNCVGLIGKPVTLSFKIKVSSTTKLDNIKVAIVEWTGTADTVTSDIVSTWNAEGTNPTLITNASYVNTPVNINAQNSWTEYGTTNAQPFTGTVSGSAKNLIVFIWSDVTDTTAGDFIYITDVQLEAGSVATPYDRLPIDAQLERCLRYTYGLWQTSANAPFGIGLCTATNKFDTIIPYPVPMRGTPSATYSAGTTFRIYTTASFAGNTIATSAISRNALHMQATRTAADLTSGTAGLFQDANSGTLAYVVVSAEL